MATLGERWAAYLETQADGGDGAGRDFAVRGDGSLVFFDAEGYFLLVSTGPGPNPGAPGETVPDVLALEGPDGTREAVYCEPIWVAGYVEVLLETLGLGTG